MCNEMQDCADRDEHTLGFIRSDKLVERTARTVSCYYENYLKAGDTSIDIYIRLPHTVSPQPNASNTSANTMFTPIIIPSDPISATSIGGIIDRVNLKSFQKVELSSLKYSDDKMN